MTTLATHDLHVTSLVDQDPPHDPKVQDLQNENPISFAKNDVVTSKFAYLPADALIKELIWKPDNEHDRLELKKALEEHLARGSVIDLERALEANFQMAQNHPEYRVPYTREDRFVKAVCYLLSTTPGEELVLGFHVRSAFARTALSEYQQREAQLAALPSEQDKAALIQKIHSDLTLSSQRLLPRQFLEKHAIVDLHSSPYAIILHVFAPLPSDDPTKQLRGLHITALGDDDLELSVVVVSYANGTDERARQTQEHELEHARGCLYQGRTLPQTIEQRLIDETCAGLAGDDLPYDRSKVFHYYMKTYLEEAKREIEQLGKDDKLAKLLRDDLEQTTKNWPQFTADVAKAFILIDTLCGAYRDESEKLVKAEAMSMKAFIIPLLRTSSSFADFNTKAEAFLDSIKRSQQG